MSEHVAFLVIGLGTGSVYLALALGLVVVHKGTATINFAQGAMAVWAAYVFDEVRKTGRFVLPLGELPVGTSPWVGFGLGVLSACAIALLCHALVFRPLHAAPPLAKVVASVGILLSLQALIVLRFSAESRFVGPILPNQALSIGSVSFTRDRLLLAGIGVAAAGVLWAYFRFTRPGLATLAGAEDPTALALAGYSPVWLAGASWVVATCISAGMVVLAAPSTGLNPSTYTLFVVPALAVALIGRLSSILATCVAGLALGAFQSEVTLLSSREWWPSWASTGLADAVPFLLIVVALYVVGHRLPRRDHGDAAQLPEVPRGRPNVPAAVLAVAATATVLVLSTGSYRFGVITSMGAALVALSFVVLTGLVGQVSLAQAALAGAGGFALSRLTSEAGVPFPVAPVAAAGLAAVLGVLVGLPALRIRGTQLAIVTLALAVAIEQFVFRNRYLMSADGNLIAEPSVLGIDLGVRSAAEPVRWQFGWLVLATLVLAATLVNNLVRSASGRAMLAVRTNERAAAAAGVDVAFVKVAAFAFSSFLAGLGGAFIGYSRGQLSVDSFTVLAGLSLLAAAYLSGITSVGGALLAGLLAPLGLVYVMFDRALDLGRYYGLVAGASLVVTAVTNPEGVVGQIRRTAGRARRAAIGGHEVEPVPSA